MLPVPPQAHRRYKKALQGAHHSQMRTDQASLRKQVLLRCLLYRARQSNPSTSDSKESGVPASEDTVQCDLEHRALLSLQNKLRISSVNSLSRAPRRTRTRVVGPQRIIQQHIDEIKQCLRSVHLNAWFLRQAAALRRCPDSDLADPKAYFIHKRQYLLRYRDRYVADWETELDTLLGALRAPPWDKNHWRSSLNLVLDSVQVVIEAM